MAIAGSWREAHVQTVGYTGATRWGTGANPIHGVRENFPRHPLGSEGPGDTPPEYILGPSQWGYATDDPSYAGIAYEYEDEYPSWDRTPMRDTTQDYPSWGDQGMPGTPGGQALLATSHGVDQEVSHANAVPTRGSTGGWENKEHGPVLDSRTADPSQLTVNTSPVQLRKPYEDTRAQARGTDMRSSIEPRITGMREKSYARSRGMGGGPGTPDMSQLSTDRIPKRPFFYRSAGVPGVEPGLTYPGISYFTPIERSVPVLPGEQVTAQEATSNGSYGYSDGDYYA